MPDCLDGHESSHSSAIGGDTWLRIIWLPRCSGIIFWLLSLHIHWCRKYRRDWLISWVEDTIGSNLRLFKGRQGLTDLQSRITAFHIQTAQHFLYRIYNKWFFYFSVWQKLPVLFLKTIKNVQYGANLFFACVCAKNKQSNDIKKQPNLDSEMFSLNLFLGYFSCMVI